VLRYWLAAAVSFAFATFVALTGGIRGSFYGIPFSARRVVPICIVAWVFVVLAARTADASRLDQRIAGIRATVRRFATPIGAGLAAATFGVAMLFGAFTAAGADPYGYVSQAGLWADGNPAQIQTELAMRAPWPNAESSFCPLGYRPAAVSGLIVPMYASGVPLQMAALVRAAGPRAAYLLVPLCGAIVVWLTFVIGREVTGSSEAALVAALLLALSPPFMFQVMQPTSDVPATAWWLVGIVAASDRSARGAGGSGAATSIAVLTRPNLLPLAVPLLGLAAWDAASHMLDVRRVAAFAIGMAPGVALAAAVNVVFYGSPLASGYGSLSEIYRLSYAATNVARYSIWLWQTYSVFIFLAPCALLMRPLRRHAAQAMAFTIVLGACYMFYRPFDHWTYLRFLLPAIPWLVIMATSVVFNASGRWLPRLQAAMLAVIATVFGLSCLKGAVEGDAFAVKALFDDRYRVAAASVAAQTPTRSAIISLLQSGSLRYYANRLTVRFDLIDREWLGRSVEYLSQKDRPPYLALEATETGDYASRFGARGVALLQAGSHTLDPKGLVTLFGPLTPATVR
jgi:hypothetical protein